MKILMAGGIYIDQSGNAASFIGGHEVAVLTATHSRHTVHLHTNLSSESTEQTKELKRRLRAHGVDPRIAGRVSAPYGTIDGETVEPGSNVFETVRADRTADRDGYDLFILTTDIAERDFRWLLARARREEIPVIVFTCGEYTSYSDHDIVNVVLAETGVPEYHRHTGDIRNILAERGIIEHAPVERSGSGVKSPFHTVLRVLAQLLAIGVLVGLAILGVLYLIGLTGGNAAHEADIDPDQAVDHADCGTIEECRALGDDHLAALNSYIDIRESPHMFVENRSRIHYITYTVADFALTSPTAHEALPVGSQEEFEAIWTRFRTFFPDEHIKDIDQFELFSDGEGNTLAYVDVTETGTTLAVDIRDNRNLPSEYRTLIHEFAHVYSLPIEAFEDNSTDLDQLKEDTLMADYTERFWSQYGEEWIENKFKSQPESEAFYNNNINDFHEPYQATNPKEDFAITFLHFIINEMPEESSQLKDIKVRALYEDPELVGLRVDILSNILEYEKERALSEAQSKD
ncbi:hypothetical protein [Salinicoccus bachuensis]|uniref:Uncharacterized protein n=1 Tax=Salinicoccus bachuensis TaxID=3136731 RepID=A0ABZ3CM01_9STAP